MEIENHNSSIYFKQKSPMDAENKVGNYDEKQDIGSNLKVALHKTSINCKGKKVTFRHHLKCTKLTSPATRHTMSQAS